MKTKSIKFLCMLFSILMLGACTKDEETFTGNILGKVSDSSTGEVLQGVTVTITPGGTSRTTGSDGYFEFRDLEPKQYEIQARKSGYTTNNKTVTVVTGREVSGDIQLSPIVEDGKMELSVNSLNFGNQNSSLSFSILNKGNKSFNWNISGIDVDWLSVSPTSGSTAKGKSTAIKVSIDREKMTTPGTYSTNILVNADDESLCLNINADVDGKKEEIENRFISVNPGYVNIGTAESASISLYSYNGPTDFILYTDGDASWATFSEVVGTIPAFDPYNTFSTVKTLTVYADRTGLDAGFYNFTLIIRTDLDDYEIPISMIVNQNNTGGGNTGGDNTGGDNTGGGSDAGTGGITTPTVTGTITSYNSKLKMSMVECWYGSSYTQICFKVQNTGSSSVPFWIRGGDSYSTAYDDLGNTYNGYNFKVCFSEDGYYTASSLTEMNIPAGATIKAYIRIYGVPSDATKFTNIRLDGYGSNYMEFRNVGINK